MQSAASGKPMCIRVRDNQSWRNMQALRVGPTSRPGLHHLIRAEVCWQGFVRLWAGKLAGKEPKLTHLSLDSKRSSLPASTFSFFLSSSPTNASYISVPNFVRCLDTFFLFSLPLQQTLFLCFSQQQKTAAPTSAFILPNTCCLPTYSRVF